MPRDGFWPVTTHPEGTGRSSHRLFTEQSSSGADAELFHFGWPSIGSDCSGHDMYDASRPREYRVNLTFDIKPEFCQYPFGYGSISELPNTSFDPVTQNGLVSGSSTDGAHTTPCGALHTGKPF
ncbi:hypothetical protein BDW67DRAFT_21627 [Aspergillus spinulosporus]